MKYEAPVFVAPVGVQGILHQDAELASAAAAAACGVPYIMSTAAHAARNYLPTARATLREQVRVRGDKGAAARGGQHAD